MFKMMRWSEAIAVGSLAFVERVKNDLGIKAMHRQFEPLREAYVLRERSEPYARKSTIETDDIMLENTIAWEENAETAET